MNQVFENYESQMIKEKELIVLLHGDQMDSRMWEDRARQSRNVSLYPMKRQLTLGECLNYGIRQAKHGVIAKFDDDDFYGPGYLQEALETLQKTGSAIVGKRYYHVYVEELQTVVLYGPPKHEGSTVTKVSGATLAFRRELFDKIQFPHVSIGEDTKFQEYCCRLGLPIHSSSRYHYVRIVKADPGHHTWKVNAEKFIKSGTIINMTGDYKSAASPVK